MVLLTTPDAFASPPLTGLVGHYHMNAKLEDSTGNGGNPRMNGASFVVDRFGKQEGALGFAKLGDAAWVNHPSLPVGSSPRTLSLWARADSYVSGVDTFFLGYGALAPGQWSAMLVPKGKRTPAFTQFGLAAGMTDPIVPAPLGVWYHMAFTYDGAVASFFVNGKLTDALPLNVDTAQTEELRFGYLDNERYLVGAIDDVRIFNRPLSVSEVGTLYKYESTNSFGAVLPPRRAQGVATVNSGFITGIQLTEAGWGYSAAPKIQIVGTGSGASALAILKDGAVGSVIVLSSGSGYLQPPVVIFEPPVASPLLSISTASVKLVLLGIAGQRYQYETSRDNQVWEGIGEPFTAGTDEVVTIFPVTSGSQVFRVRLVDN